MWAKLIGEKNRQHQHYFERMNGRRTNIAKERTWIEQVKVGRKDSLKIENKGRTQRSMEKEQNKDEDTKTQSTED